jgi:hypothetical protein
MQKVRTGLADQALAAERQRDVELSLDDLEDLRHALTPDRTKAVKEGAADVDSSGA